MSQINTLTKNANQLAEIRADFLRALRGPGGADVILVESVTTGGVWDSERDQMTGATTSEKRTTLNRYAMTVQVNIDDAPGPNENSAFAEGHNLGSVGISQVLVCKVRPGLPLSAAYRYEIMGNTYKFEELLSVKALGPRLPLWNLVKFVRG